MPAALVHPQQLGNGQPPHPADDHHVQPAVGGVGDPVREDVPEAVGRCLKAGIDVKIVTGDTPATAREIARQLRLRDLGGIVIIDFIDLHKAQNKQALFDEMVKLMSTDKAKHTVLPLTKFGLMQITRQRVRPVAVEEVSDVCPTCNGTGKIEPTVLLDKKIENQISFLTQDRGHKFIKLVVSPYVAAFLRKGLWSLRRRWEWKYKLRLHVVEDQSLGIVEVHYHDDKDNDLINK